MPTKSVQLSNGDFFVIDERDFEYVSQFQWYFNGTVIHRNIYYSDFVEHVYLGRELLERMGFNLYEKEHDHIDKDPHNNRRENLRVATHQENNTNKNKQSNNMSGYKGVSWENRSRKWASNIYKNGIKYFIGYYKDKEEAARAYDHFAKLLHGEFACLNFPEKPKPRCFFDDFLELNKVP